MTITAEIPDLHYFAGKGEKDAFPLWKNSAATEPNINRALLDLLSEILGVVVSPEEFFAYIVGMLGSAAYTERFYSDLGESSARVPITKSLDVFGDVAAFGRTLIAVETYGERFPEAISPRFSGASRIETSPGAGDYPEEFEYNAVSSTLTVGEGVLSGVSPEVWEFEVSGLRVVASWLGYRMQVKKGLVGPLDEIQPRKWSFDDELIQVLWAVEYVAGATTTGAALLDRVIAGDVFTDSELPEPTDSEAAAPVGAGDTLFDKNGGGDEDDDEG